MIEEKSRHMFPGGNTPLGFYSYYDYIIDKTTANRLFILKGGPGTGKSTLMKKIGYELASKGYDIEFMHCSSDNDSLDGIVAPKLSFAIIDGTSPHITDPVYPGVVDEIVNLGQFWDQKGLMKHRDDIIIASKRKKASFERAYRYLKAASFLLDDTEKIYKDALDKGAKLAFTHKIKELLFGNKKPSKVPGKQRRLFASAITPKGYVNYLDSLCVNHSIIRLSAQAGMNTGHIMEILNDEALYKGFNTETYYCPMVPDKIEHVVIPDLKLSIITANEYYDITDINIDNCKTYNMEQFYKDETIQYYSDQLKFNRLYADTIIQKAVESIALAKSYHTQMEKYYIKNMDFKGLSELKDILMQRIM